MKRNETKKKSFKFKGILLFAGLAGLIYLLFFPLAKISPVFSATALSFLRPQFGIFAWKQLVGLSSFWAILIPVLVGTLEFCIWFILVGDIIDWLKGIDPKKIRKSKVLKNVVRWLIAKSDYYQYGDRRAVNKLAPRGYLGIFLCGLVPVLFLYGTAIIKIYRYQYGFWFLIVGNTIKMVLLGLLTIKLGGIVFPIL